MTARHLTTAVTMLVLTGLLVLGAAWGWQALFEEVPGTEQAAEPTPSCSTEVIRAGDKVRAGQVTVSVYNGGTRNGLADQTLDALTRRGFRPGEVGNAPDDVDVRRVQVWSTIENDPRARLVARQFGKKTRVRFSDEDLGLGIDVIVGNGFRKLAKAPRSVSVKQRRELCLPVESTAPVG